MPFRIKDDDKKWKEKDKKRLMDMVRSIYLQMRKLRINITKVDPKNKRHKKKIEKLCGQKRRRDEVGHEGESETESMAREIIEHDILSRVFKNSQTSEPVDEDVEMKVA